MRYALFLGSGSLAWWLVVASSPSIAAEYVYRDQQVKLGQGTQTLVDPARVYNRNNIHENFDRFKSLDADGLSFGINQSVWLKFHLDNQSSESLVLQTRSIFIDQLELYEVTPSGLRLVGERSNFAPFPEEAETRHFALPMSVAPGERREYLLHLDSQKSISLEIIIATQDELRRQESQDDLAFTYSLGTTLTLVAFNFFLFALTRDRKFGAYSAAQAGVLLVNLTLQGYGFKHLWPGYPQLNAIAINVAVAIGSWAGLLFNYWFLELDRNQILSRINRAVLVLGFIYFGFASLVNHSIVFEASLLLVAIVLMLVVFNSVFALWSRNLYGGLYILAWSPILLGAAANSLAGAGLIKQNFFTSYGLLLGSSVEGLLLAMALGLQYNQEKKQKYLFMKLAKDSEVKRAEAEIRAEEGEKNTRLLRVLCHDVVNPVNVILVCLQVLENQRLAAETKHIIEKIHRASYVIVDITKQVRSLVALKSGKIAMKLEPVSLFEVFDQCRFIFEEALTRKNIRLQTNLRADHDVEILTDKVSFSNDVINNLISNAIKFSNPGGEIVFSYAAKEDGVEITIKDEGIGIPAELLSQIFESDARTSRVGTAGEKGTGFGMPLVKSLVDAYGGSIKIDSVTQDEDPHLHGTTARIWVRSAKRQAA